MDAATADGYWATHQPQPNQQHQLQDDPDYFSRPPLSPSPPSPSSSGHSMDIDRPRDPKVVLFDELFAQDDLEDEYAELPDLVDGRNEGWNGPAPVAEGGGPPPEPERVARARLARAERSRQEKERQLSVLEVRDSKLLAETLSNRDKIDSLLEPAPPQHLLPAALLDAINLVLEADQYATLSPNNEAFRLRTSTPALCEYHRQRLLQPLALDVERWIAAGVLEEVSRDITAQEEEPNGVFESYERIFSLLSLRDFEKAAMLYWERFPADRGLVTFWRAWIKRKMEAGQMDTSSRVDIPYEGVCLYFNPLQRLLATKDESSRVGNFITLITESGIPFEYTSFKLPHLAIPIEDPHSVLFNRTLSELEAIAVATTRRFSLISAVGGTRVYIPRQPELHDILHRFGATQAQLDEKLPRDDLDHPVVKEKIESLTRCLEDELQFFTSLPAAETGTVVDPSTPGGAKAKAAIIGDTTSINSRGGGHTLSMMGSKDVPKKDVEGIQTFTGDEAGRSGWLMWQETAMVHQLDVNSTLGERMIQPIVDLWVWILKHILIIFVLAFLSRKIQIVDPMVLVLQSSKVNNLIHSNFLRTIFQTNASNRDLQDFFSCARRTTRAWLLWILIIIVIIWKETPAEDWIAMIGTFYVAHTGPFESSICLAFSTPDPGWNAHDPRLHPLLLPVELTCAALMAIARSCAADWIQQGRLPPKEREARLAYFRALLEEILRQCQKAGLLDRLKMEKEELALVANAISGLRTRGGYERAKAKLLDMGVSLEEIAAERSRRMSEHRLSMARGPEFIGPPVKLSLPPSSFGIDGRLNSTALDSHLAHPRIQQYVSLLCNHYEAVEDRRILKNDLPSVHGSTIGDVLHFQWFSGAPEGAQIKISAAQYGKTQNVERTEEEATIRLEGYVDRGIKREEARREEKGVTNRGEIPIADAVLRVAGSDFVGAQQQKSRREITLISCDDCGCSFTTAAVAHVTHICHAVPDPNSPNTFLQRVDKSYAKNSNTLRRDRLLFPAHLFLLLNLNESQISDLVAKAGSLIEVNALSVLPSPLDKVFRSHFPPPTEVSIWITNTTTEEDIVTSAIDALVDFCTAPPDPEQRRDRDDDFWWDKGSKTLEKILKHMLEGGKSSIRRAECQHEKCDYVAFMPNGTSKSPEKEQHRCHGFPEKKKVMMKKKVDGQEVKEEVEKIIFANRMAPLDAQHIGSILGLPRNVARRLVYAVSTDGDDLMKGLEGGIEELLGWSVEVEDFEAGKTASRAGKAKKGKSKS